MKGKPKSFKASLRGYEKWLRSQVEVWDDDLCKKHKKMKDSAVSFLRATYWRWAERIFDPDACPGLDHPPYVLAVGDIHIENFGTWRDNDGRLVWGVNDFDEAAEMPYTLDLVRLATSAILGRSKGNPPPEEICKHLLHGYTRGLKQPEPLILDERHHWLLTHLKVRPKHRTKFWRKIDKLPSGKPEARYRDAINSALPGSHIELTFHERHGEGIGSLGRPRWVGVGQWRGGPVVREAKVLVPSAWTLAHTPDDLRMRCGELASGVHRAPDPYYKVVGNTVVRRLSPNNRKIELADKTTPSLVTSQILQAMGREIAALHSCSARDRDKIRSDLSDRGSKWLLESVTVASDFLCADYDEWRDS